ncbi:unnamed protein product [Ranitomeya imitator]|uniref:EGF-like domain-containing protein n=1 Tax=Ranitomeya imitator TaxID=111125 RepID=A0ABN9L7F3_9NEOB|nr:unnamed protein product [Ranitomeya imitator]
MPNDNVSSAAFDKLRCSCAEGFDGPTCAVNRDECKYSDCENGGTCVDGINMYTCQCTPQYTGEYCEQLLDFCSAELNPCHPDSKCITTAEGPKCECAPGYIGENCSLNYDDCKDHRCQNNAQCVDEVNGYSCQCTEGFSGQLCEMPSQSSTLTNPCKLADCQNGAKCIDLGNSAVCQCLPGFGGNRCEKLLSVNFVDRDTYLQFTDLQNWPRANITLQSWGARKVMLCLTGDIGAAASYRYGTHFSLPGPAALPNFCRCQRPGKGSMPPVTPLHCRCPPLKFEL